MALLAWFVWDMRSMLIAGQQKNRLSIEGRWKDLENHFKRGIGSRRPFVWFHRKYLVPGNLETQYALFLYSQGRLEESLIQADRAIRKNRRKPVIFRSIYSEGTFKTFCGALRTRMLILDGLGRYDEARKAAAELQKSTGSRREPNAALALLEYHCGHLDEALALAQATSSPDSQDDSMHGLASIIFTLKGDFERALEALSFEPASADKFYTPAGLKIMHGSPEGTELIALQQKKLAGVFPSVRLIMLARVYLVMEDFEKAGEMLDAAEKSFGPEPGLQLSYYHHRAFCFAGRGKSKEADDCIERMRAIVKETPKRSRIWETHFAAGRSHLYLQRFGDAVAELLEAQRSVLHPIERHATAYWIAKAYESAGNAPEARRFYQVVVADAIPSRLHGLAMEALAAS